ncbi:hypothetical protein H8356DRAFT_420386 [Neocallimastix lanati (nom. inval.)]|nr:hypothetical protein H8356DRAFT_420386 [Neocallimastix sp. JGI-2020a]
MIKKSIFSQINIPSKIICSICGKVICNSYYTKCKHSFCKVCIMNYLRNFHKCPMCSTVLKENEVYLNILLKQLELVNSLKTLNGDVSNDLAKKFKQKFEYVDFLIELTVLKNYLKKLYKKKLTVCKKIINLI